MKSSKRPIEDDHNDEIVLKKLKEDEIWKTKAYELIKIIKIDIIKKFPLLAEEIFSFIEANVIHFDKEKDIATYFICFYMIVRSEIGYYCLISEDSLYDILEIFLKFIQKHNFILCSSDLYSFDSLLNIIKLDDFWDLNILDKRIIYNFIYEYMINKRESCKY